jgi:hypothetical protein
MTQLYRPLHIRETGHHLAIHGEQGSEVEGLVQFHKIDPGIFHLTDLMYWTHWRYWRWRVISEDGNMHQHIQPIKRDKDVKYDLSTQMLFTYFNYSLFV